VLAEFRGWLRAEASAAPAAEPGEAPPPVDLHTLLGQFTALRHEVNLQTKAVRAQQEQNAETLRQLTEALDALAAAQDARPQAAASPEDDRLRPLLKTLVDVYDALAVAGREIGRVRDFVLPALAQAAAVAEAAPPRPPWWARWLGARPPDAAERERRRDQARAAAEGVAHARAAFEALIAGYTMTLQRLDRALAEHGLEPIPAVGRPFDPELMEAVEAAAGGGRPAGEVLAEVRRGYRLNGRVFRYALVRVAKS
jgi:molecular chaperone GrpE